MQSSEEGLELRPDAGGHLGIGDQLHVLQLILLGDHDARPARHQLPRLYLPEVVAVVGEVELQVVFYWRILQYPG